MAAKSNSPGLSGGRAALAGHTLRDLGYTSVFNAGGFKELAAAGLDTEPA